MMTLILDCSDQEKFELLRALASLWKLLALGRSARGWLMCDLTDGDVLNTVPPSIVSTTAYIITNQAEVKHGVVHPLNGRPPFYKTHDVKHLPTKYGKTTTEYALYQNWVEACRREDQIPLHNTHCDSKFILKTAIHTTLRPAQECDRLMALDCQVGATREQDFIAYFTAHTLRELRELVPANSPEEIPTPTVTPRNSRLTTAVMKQVFVFDMPQWRLDFERVIENFVQHQESRGSNK